MVGVTAYGIALADESAETEIRWGSSGRVRHDVVRALESGESEALNAIALPEDVRTALAALVPAVASRASGEPVGEPTSVSTLNHTIRDAIAGRRFAAFSTTADELLFVPIELDDVVRLRCLRAFVAMLESPVYLAVYGHLATGAVSHIYGDVPRRDRLSAALAKAQLDVANAQVVDLAGGLPSVTGPDSVFSLRAFGRLSVVADRGTRTLEGAGRPLSVSFGRYACPNLTYASQHTEPFVVGAGSDARTASTIARAEGAERFATGDIASMATTWGRAEDLDSAIPLTDLVAYSDRQLAEKRFERWTKASECRWVLGESLDGTSCWVPAAAAVFPYRDNASLPPFTLASTSGVAAGRDFDTAKRSAAAELIERDAFMRVWLARESPAEIVNKELPGEVGSWARAMARDGWHAAMFDITASTWPVVMGVARRGPSLLVTAASRATRAAAAVGAAKELYVATATAVIPETIPTLEEVSTPLDHQAIYLHGVAGAQAAFLYANRKRPSRPDCDRVVSNDPLEALACKGMHPVVVDLTSAASSPFAVARVLVPGLIPISFGFDREPLGLIAQWAGTRVVPSASRGLRPLVPHPFG